MARTNVKTKVADPVAEFEAARAEFKPIAAKHREMHDRLESMQMALNYGSAASLSNVPAKLLEKAKPFMRLASRKPEKLRDQISDLQIEAEDFQPFYNRATAAWQDAMQCETDRIALTLQDRHQAAVQDIASALENLLRACAEELACHDELKDRAPLTASSYLPRLSDEWRDVCVSVWSSRAWYWGRRIKKLGIIGGLTDALP